MDITKLVLGFQSFLDSTLKALSAVGTGPDEEEWDDFVEAAFALFVTRPLESRSGIVSDVVYDVWKPGGFATEIRVRPRALPSDVMVGTPVGGESVTNYVFETATIVDCNFSFAFRAFTNLLHPDAAPTEFVMGEVRDPGAAYPTGTQVYIRSDLCSFEIAAPG